MAKNKDKHPDITKIFPLLSDGVRIRRWPPHDYQLIFQEQLATISPGAVQLFLSCDGVKSLYDIMRDIGDDGDADDRNEQEKLMLFVREAERNGILTLSGTKSSSPKISTVTGSFSVHYPSQLSLELTDQCNLHCAHCYLGAASNSHPQYIQTDQLLCVLRTLYDHGLRIVELTGGEPLLHPDFFKIYDFCLAQFPAVALFTNGTQITDDIAQRLHSKHSNLIVNISLDGSTPHTHNKIRGHKEAFENTTKAMKLLAHHGIPYRVSMSVFPDTQDDVEPTVKLAQSLGASSFTFSPVLPFGRANQIQWDHSNTDILSREQSFEQIIQKYPGFIQKIGEETIRKMGVQKSPNCGAGYSRYVVSPTGDIRPCHMAMNDWFSMGNILHDQLEQVFSSPITTFLRSLQSPSKDNYPCNSCRYRLFCNHCWVRAINRNTQGHPPCEWFTNQKIDQFM